MSALDSALLALADPTRRAILARLARGEATGASDVDLLVDLEPGRSLLDLGGLLSDLQTALACDVDVATRAMLKGRVRERVLREAVPL